MHRLELVAAQVKALEYARDSGLEEPDDWPTMLTAVCSGLPDDFISGLLHADGANGQPTAGIGSRKADGRGGCVLVAPRSLLDELDAQLGARPIIRSYQVWWVTRPWDDQIPISYHSLPYIYTTGCAAAIVTCLARVCSVQIHTNIVTLPL